MCCLAYYRAKSYRAKFIGKNLLPNMKMRLIHADNSGITYEAEYVAKRFCHFSYCEAA